MKPWFTEICERVNARRDNPPNKQQDALDALNATFASYVSSQCGDLISCLIERCEQQDEELARLRRLEEAAIHWNTHRCVHGVGRLERAIAEAEKARDA